MMLHIVQAVLSGKAEMPKLFLDEAEAESAYVECVKKYWAQSYPAFCDRNGIESNCFASAKAFVEGLDLADTSKIHYWIVTPGDTGLDRLMGSESDKERREHIKRLTGEVEQASLAVKERFNELADKIAALTDAVNGGDVRRPEECSADRPEIDSELPTLLLPQEKPDETDEKYKTPEWKNYVEYIKNMSGGVRSEFRQFTRQDWRQDIYSNATSFEYWEWVAVKIDDCIRKAEYARYLVLEDLDHPGHYTFKTPDGLVSELSFSTEEEAWCHTALQVDGEKLPS